MSAMLRDLKAAGQEVYEEEHVLNVIRALPNDNEHWKSFKVFMTHSERIKTFEAISKHLEMEEERLKLYVPPSVAFVAKGSGPRAGNLTMVRNLRRAPVLLKTLASMLVLPRSIRLRATELRIWHV